MSFLYMLHIMSSKICCAGLDFVSDVHISQNTNLVPRDQFPQNQLPRGQLPRDQLLIVRLSRVHNNKV